MIKANKEIQSTHYIMILLYLSISRTPDLPVGVNSS